MQTIKHELKNCFVFNSYFKMAPTSIKTNREVVKSLWKQNVRNAKEISRKTGIPLRFCERYVSFLRKNGKIPNIHRSGRLRKLSSEKRRQVGMIIKHNS